MNFQFKIETDDGNVFQCAVSDIHYTKMQDAIDILSAAFDEVIEAYRTKNHSAVP